MSWLVKCPTCGAENEFYDSVIEARHDTVKVECQSCEAPMLLVIDRVIRVDAKKIGE
jgi:uncharacterized Zn finger protein